MSEWDWPTALDKLEAIHAYDEGAVDSGVKDEALRRELVAWLDAQDEEAWRLNLSRWVRNAYLSEKGLQQGYGWEDALKFLKYIDDGAYRGPSSS